MFTVWFVGALVMMSCLVLLVIFNDDVGTHYKTIHKAVGVYLIATMSISWALTLIVFLILAIDTHFTKPKGVV